MIIRPQNGPQELFLSTNADIAIYGGQAGGGKSWSLLMGAARYITRVEGYGATIFRRTRPDITNEGGLWDESQKIYPYLDGIPRTHPNLDWRFFSKGWQKSNRISFSSLQYEKDVYNFQGAQIPYIGFDELTHFSEKQFFYLISRNRTTCGVRPVVRATTNPDSTSFVRNLVDWWIEPETGLAIPDRSGKVRFFLKHDDEIHWADSREELLNIFGEEKKDSILSFTFIPASLSDNKILMDKDPQYKARLEMQGLVERARLLGGNWNIKEEDGMVPENWWLFYDSLPPVMKYIWSWDLAVKEGDRNDYTVGLLWAVCQNGYYLVDMEREKIDYPKQKKLIQECFKRRASEEIIIEDKANGGPVIQELKQTTKLPVIAITPIKSKIERVNLCSPIIESGNVFLPEGDNMTRVFLREWNCFPSKDSGVHDDIVDATTQFLNRVNKKAHLGFTEAQKKIINKKMTPQAHRITEKRW